MNEQTQDLVNQILERAISGVDTAVAFSQEQIPQVIMELLWWHGIRSALLFAVALLLLVCVVFLAKRTLAAKKIPPVARDNDDRPPYIPTLAYDRDGDLFHFGIVLFGCALATVLLSSALVANIDWLQILVAPRLYLIEYAAELAK